MINESRVSVQIKHSRDTGCGTPFGGKFSSIAFPFLKESANLKPMSDLLPTYRRAEDPEVATEDNEDNEANEDSSSTFSIYFNVTGGP